MQATFVSSEEPDTIGVEFALGGNMLFDMTMGEEGEIAVLFDEIANSEFPLPVLRELLDRGESELKNWHTRLTQPDGIWGKP